MEGGKKAMRAGSGRHQLAADENTGSLLFPGGFGSAAAEVLKGPCRYRYKKRNLVRRKVIFCLFLHWGRERKEMPTWLSSGKAFLISSHG